MCKYGRVDILSLLTNIITVFKGFTNVIDGYDISLMKLSLPVIIDGFTTNPISLPSGNQLSEIDQTFCYISGWGLTESMPIIFPYIYVAEVVFEIAFLRNRISNKL